MTSRTDAAAIHSISELIVKKALINALLEFKIKATFSQTGNRRAMNGKILVNGIDHLDNIKKITKNKEENNLKEANYSEPAGNERKLDDQVNLQTIEEEERKDSSESSDDELSESLSGESDSDISDGDDTLSDSSVEEQGTKLNFTTMNQKKNAGISQNDEEKTPLQNGKFAVKEAHNELTKNISSHTNILASSVSSGTTGNNNNTLNGSEQLDHTVNKSLNKDHVSLPVVIEKSSDFAELSTSGSSDIIMGTRHKNRIVSLENAVMNNSGTGSDDSELKDQTDLLAELQKIVQDEEQLQQSSIKKRDNTNLHHLPPQLSVNASSADEWDGVWENSQSVPEKFSRNSGGNVSNGASVGVTGEDGMSEDGGSVVRSHGNSLGIHGNKQDTDHDIGKPSGNLSGHLSSGDGTRGNGGGDGHTISYGGGESRDDDQEISASNENDKASHNLKDTTPVANKTQSLPNKQSTKHQATNLNNKDELLENVEKKLLELEKSNTQQTSEIQRLKTVNDALKIKFEKLEKSSGDHHYVENQMLKRNEELEKHLLGVLKSQEIIFDMKENLKAATNDNEKLTKDYQEAVKALEAVDKLFGQKDALVKKWKEATEDSRRLVELLKKHNAEESDLENIDKLKDNIAKMQEKLSKAEQTNEVNMKKNEEWAQQSKLWNRKFEHENEKAIKLNFELQEVKKELKNHQKLTARRGRKNQLLHLELTELKDTLKLAKEKMVENERRLKEMERKNHSIQETYTNIIHEKEKQHSILIKNSESYQKDLVTNIQIAEGLRKEIESLNKNILGLESEKERTKEKLTSSEKSLEEMLAKQTGLSTELAKLQSELEKSKTTVVDNELYAEEQTVRLQELEGHCRELQGVLQQFIYGSTKRHKRHSPHGKKLRPSHTFPAHPNLEMYRRLLAPPTSMRTRRRIPATRQAKQFGLSDEDNIEDNLGEPSHNTGESFNTSKLHSSLQQPRPKSTYGNRSLSGGNESSHHEHDRDWVPKIVLVDSQKLGEASDNESGSVSADQHVMDYVKVGDKVLIELPVEGKKQNLASVVKYVGPVYHKNFKAGIYAGLKLDIPVGDTNGTIDGRRYFHCLKKHGKFIKLSHILAVQNPRTQQFTRILPLG